MFVILCEKINIYAFKFRFNFTAELLSSCFLGHCELLMFVKGCNITVKFLYALSGQSMCLRKPWRDIFTYYLSLITNYLLLITYYLSLITYYLLLIISFITPITAGNSKYTFPVTAVAVVVVVVVVAVYL